MDRALALLSDRLRSEIESHVDRLLDNNDVQAFRESMARSVIQHQAAAFLLGQDSKRLTLDDQRTIAAANRFQLDYLDSFVEQVAAGDYAGLEKQLRARAALYTGSVKSIFWEGKTKGLNLPGMPGDGQTPCLQNCRCSWQIRDDGAYWRLSDAEHCSGCVERSRKWNPYRAS